MAATKSNGHGSTPARAIRLTYADTITLRPVRWLWSNRIAVGTLCLLGGRESVGKSVLTCTLAANLTRGTLPGIHLGQPRTVLVVATEDSWEHTIGPRFVAAGADLTRVARVDVITRAGADSVLSLPIDLLELKATIQATQAAMLVLDPLISRLNTTLDTHKDAEVRVALEPLVALANQTDIVPFGLVHVNKSLSSDPLTTLMGSRAFTAVARSVLFAMADPDDADKRLLGQPKNNLGRTNLPALSFRINDIVVGHTPEGDITTGQLEWLGDSAKSLSEAIAASAGTADEQSAVTEAAEWLQEYLEAAATGVDSKPAKAAAKFAGHSARTLFRARALLKIHSQPIGFPRKVFWSLPTARARGDSGTTGTTAWHNKADTETF